MALMGIAALMALSTVRVVTRDAEGTFLAANCRLDGGRTFEDYVECVTHHRRVKRYYRDDPYGHPCHAFVRLNQPERRVTNQISKLTDSALCDSSLRRRWYKFDGPAGGVMPTECVTEFSCGTHAPVWLNGRHPEQYGEALDREVCVSLAGDCCARRWFIRVANCGDFYTYLLTDTPGCFMAYCAGDQLPCPDGQSSPTGFSPGCSDNFPVLSGTAQLVVSKDSHQVVFYCDYEGPIPADTQLDVDWFVRGDQSGEGDHGKFPVWTDTMIERRRSVLTEGRWMGKMGSTIFCRIRGRWRDQTGVPGIPINSRKYFAGIEILNRVVNVNEAKDDAFIQLRATVPVSCLPQFDQACGIDLQIAHDQEYQSKQCLEGKMQQVVFGDCSVRITPDNWNQVHNVSVKAVRDFYNDGNKNMRIDFKPIYSTLSSPLWNRYQLPEVEVIAEDEPSRMCASTGDPHYSTFDGLYYHLYKEGEFVLYKHTSLPIQINTRLERCGKTVSCNCGVAVKAADDVIVIDRCMRRNRNLAFGSSFPEGWRTLHRHALEQGGSFVDGLKIIQHDDGRRYTVHLPTGAYVDFRVGEHWINLFVYASSADRGSVRGLCGTFDGDPANDFLHPDGITQNTAVDHAACGDNQDVCSFAEAWRVPKSDSFFGDVVEVPPAEQEYETNEQYCKCEKVGPETKVVCNYHLDVQNCAADREIAKGIEKTEQLKLRSRKKRDARLTDNEDDFFNSEFIYDEDYIGQEPTWPTPSGMTQRQARSHCIDVLMKSSVGQVCKRIVLKRLPSLIDACTTDIKVTDDLEWSVSAVSALTAECVNEVESDRKYWEPESNSSTPAIDGSALLDTICPAGCSDKGDCQQGKCHCLRGFGGEDCNTRMFDPPEIYHLQNDGMCDVRRRLCKSIQVYGSTFRDSRLQCRFEKETGEVEYTKAGYDNFEEITCELPDHRVSSRHSDNGLGVTSTNYRLSIVQDSFRGNERTIFIYDSRCMNCSMDVAGVQCVPLPNTCSINGSCYSAGERHPSNCCLTCDPEKSVSSWITDKGSTELRPYQKSYLLHKGDIDWELHIHVTDEVGRRKWCGVTYSATPNDPSSPVTVLTSGAGLTLTVPRIQPASFYIDVLSNDQCGRRVNSTFNIFVLDVNEERQVMTPTTSSPTNVSCLGNIPPHFTENVTAYEVIKNELFRIKLRAVDPDGSKVEFYVLKSSRSFVGITMSGHLSYVAPSRSGEERLTVIAQDECGEKGYQQVTITTRACQCLHGGLCRPQRGLPRGAGHYRCRCPPGYRGPLCQHVRRPINLTN